MINVPKIESIFESFVLNNRIEFNATQVAFLLGNSCVNEVYEYLLSRERYILDRSYQVQCPYDLGIVKVYSSEHQITTKSLKCNCCGKRIAVNKEFVLIVFCFKESYIKHVKEKHERL